MRNKAPIDPAVARRPKYIAVATPLFQKDGYAASMAEISDRGGYSRPILYMSFSNKAQLFRAVVENMMTVKLAAIRKALPAYEDLHARLTFVCRELALQRYDLVQASAKADDLFALRFAVVHDNQIRIENLLSEILLEAVDDTALPVAAADIGRMMAASLRGFHDLAHSREDLERMIEALTATVTNAVAPGLLKKN